MTDDHPAPTAPNIDEDLAVKGFDQASETRLLLSDSLKLFLAHERGHTTNPYEDISDSESAALCAHPERLPEHLKNFILWQQNILKLDIIEIFETGMPKGFKHKYDVKGARLAELPGDEERMTSIKAYLDEQEHYFGKFNEVRAILEATEDRFITIEETLLRAASMDESVTSQIQGEKQEIEDIRKKLCALRAILEDNNLPDIVRFDKAPDIAKELMLQLSTIHVHLRDNIRKHRLAHDEA